MELNCQSLSNKIDRVMELLVENQTDVLFLNETWLNDVKNDVTVAINTYNYKIYHSNMFGRGKGVAFLVRNNFNINKRLTNYNLNTFDAIRLSVPVSTVSHQHQQLSIVCLYRYNGIGSQFDSFLNEFSNFISELTLTGYSFVIAGDFNIHMNKDNESETKNLMISCVSLMSLHTYRRTVLVLKTMEIQLILSSVIVLFHNMLLYNHVNKLLAQVIIFQ